MRGGDWEIGVKTHDNLTRRPVFCFLGGRRLVGVTALDPVAVGLASSPAWKGKVKTLGDAGPLAISPSSMMALLPPAPPPADATAAAPRFMAERVERVLTGGTDDGPEAG